MFEITITIDKADTRHFQYLKSRFQMDWIYTTSDIVFLGSGLSFWLSPQSWSVIKAVGGGNCYECNFYFSIVLISSIPTSIYTKNVFHQKLARVLIIIIIMQCVPHFHYVHKNFSSIQLLVNKKFFHQFSLKLIKNSFISPAST